MRPPLLRWMLRSAESKQRLAQLEIIDDNLPGPRARVDGPADRIDSTRPVAAPRQVPGVIEVELRGEEAGRPPKKRRVSSWPRFHRQEVARNIGSSPGWDRIGVRSWLLLACENSPHPESLRP